MRLIVCKCMNKLNKKKGITMVTYTKEEIQSSTNISRQFGAVLDKIKSKKVEKIAIMRNNNMEAVIISIDEYEKMKTFLELKEDQEIYESIKDRLDTPIEDYIDFEDVIKDMNFKG